MVIGDVVSPARIRCREIVSGDLDGIVNLLVSVVARFTRAKVQARNLFECHASS